MNRKINAFLDEVCIHINCKTVHNDVREELGEHIDELTEAYISEGIEEEKALDIAISAMGSTDEIGTNLNRQHKPQTEWSILILTALIASIGGIVMFSSSQFAEGRSINFLRYLLFVLVGMGTMFAFYHFDYTKLKKKPMLYSAFGILLIVITNFAGVEMNGLKRWLAIGGYAISVPELVSLLFFIAFAGFLEKSRLTGVSGVVKLMIYGAFHVYLMMQTLSVSTAFILFITYAILLMTAVQRNHFGENKKRQFSYLFAGGVVPVGFVIYNMIINPHLLERLIAYLPGRNGDFGGANYYQYMANKWLSLSNWFGKSDATFQGSGIDMMPNVTDTYVLVNVIATLGWAVGLMLISLIGIFIIRMFMTIKRVKNSYGFYLALSAVIMISTQFLFNILMNFNLFPAANFNMPFVSYGTTGYVINMTCIGIILSVWRRNNLISDEKNALRIIPQNSMVSFSDGKITIDLKAWKQS